MTTETENNTQEARSSAAHGSAFWVWHVRKQLPDGMFTFCCYNAIHGPVTAEHVRNSPHVKEWLGSDRLDEIYHPEGTR